MPMTPTAPQSFTSYVMPVSDTAKSAADLAAEELKRQYAEQMLAEGKFNLEQRKADLARQQSYKPVMGDIEAQFKTAMTQSQADAQHPQPQAWNEKLLGPLVDANLSRYEMDPVTGQTKLRRPEGFLEGAGALLGNFGRIAGNVSMNRRTERQPGGGVGYTYGFGYDNDRAQQQLDQTKGQQLMMDRTNPENIQRTAMLNAMINRDLAPIRRDTAVLSGQTMGRGYGGSGRGSSFDTGEPSIRDQIALARLEMDMKQFGKSTPAQQAIIDQRNLENKLALEDAKLGYITAKTQEEKDLWEGKISLMPGGIEWLQSKQPRPSPTSNPLAQYRKKYEDMNVSPKEAQVAASQQVTDELNNALSIKEGKKEYVLGPFGRSVASATKPLDKVSNWVRRFFGSPEYSVGLSSGATNSPAIMAAIEDIKDNLYPSLSAVTDPQRREQLIQTYLSKYPSPQDRASIQSIIENIITSSDGQSTIRYPINNATE